MELTYIQYTDVYHKQFSNLKLSKIEIQEIGYGQEHHDAHESFSIHFNGSLPTHPCPCPCPSLLHQELARAEL